MPTNYIVSDYQLTSIANTIRQCNGTTDDLVFPDGFISGINKVKGIPVGILLDNPPNVDPVTGKWIRPQDYPNLDAIDYGGSHNICYMTYDLRKTPDYAWIGIYLTVNSGTWAIERGHLNGSNVFVPDESYTWSSGTYFRQALDSANGDVQLWRITATNNITGFGFCPNTTTNADNYYNQAQPCVDRKGYFDYCALTWGDSGTTSSYRKHCTMWMERDALVMGRNTKYTGFGGGWSNAYRLVELDFSEWDSSNWQITGSFASNWAWCISLQSLDLSWMTNTSSWAVTSFYSNWSHCHALKSLDISHFDTSKWNVGNFSANWAYCFSLQELDLPFDTSKWTVTAFNDSWLNCKSLRTIKHLDDWDTSHWAVTNINSTWGQCCALTEIPISGWDTSNWAVTNMGATFSGCYSVITLDLHNWDTSKWAVTNFSSTFASCFALRELDIGSWDVSKWNVPSLGSTWNACYSLKELKLNNWDTSNWTVTTLGSTWSGCYSLETLEIGSWNTSNWAVTTLQNAWYMCMSLRELKLNNWDTSNWAVTSLRQTWYLAQSIQTLEISDWDTSGWAVTDMYFTFYYLIYLKVLDISDWDTSGWAVTTNSTAYTSMYMLEEMYTPASFGFTSASANNCVPNNYCLKHFSGYSISQSHSYSSAQCLTKESLVNILNRLPSVTGSKTITLGVSNYNKLTASQIAVATQKGWTVAK